MTPPPFIRSPNPLRDERARSAPVPADTMDSPMTTTPTERPFTVASDFALTGDQPQAVDKLVAGLEGKLKHQTLLGATGSGKTFTMANVIARNGRPTPSSPQQDLAAQLYPSSVTSSPERRRVPSPTTTTISPKPTSPAPTPTSPRTPTSTRRSTSFAMPPPAPSSSAATSSSSPPSPASTASASPPSTTPSSSSSRRARPRTASAPSAG